MKGQDGGGSNNKTCEEWSLTGKSFTGASSACRGPPNAPPCEVAARAVGGPGGERHLRTRSLNEEDALLFVDQVKSMCALPVYNAFLDVMKEFKAQRTSVREVIHRVSTLFKGREELIAGFNRFLPPDCRIAAAQHRPYRNAASEASTNHTSTPTHPTCFGVDGRSQHDLVERCFLPLSSGIRRKSLPFDHLNGDVNRSYCVSVDSITKTNHASSGFLVDGSRRASNRLPVKTQIPDARKPPSENNKTVSFKDVSLAEVAKYGSFSDFAFFDQARRAFKDQTVYENFLRFLALFNEEMVGGEELVRLVTPFLGRDPELLAWFKSMVSGAAGHVPRPPRPAVDEQAGLGAGAGAARVGVSYRSLPKSYARPACSGRTPLCQQVLNDQWVSFPSWSEASTFVTAPKTLYEEFTFRCEDERFDLDVVIERNASTIRVLEYVRRKLARMAPREVAKFQLDEYLGGTSTTIHQTSLKQIYGAKAKDIIEGLKRKPAVAVPVVLRRLKAKEEEWRNAQKEFNQLWREQTETYYWKSLQCQAAIFKQKDLKSLRSKVLLNEIESLHEEWREQEKASGAVFPRPHLTLLYKNRSAFDNAAYLLSHYINSHAGFQEEEKKRMRSFVNGALPQMLFGASTAPEGAAGLACARRGAYEGDAHWYLFVRLHHSLCERLGAAQQCAARLQAADERSAQASPAPLAGLLSPHPVKKVRAPAAAAAAALGLRARARAGAGAGPGAGAGGRWSALLGAARRLVGGRADGGAAAAAAAFEDAVQRLLGGEAQAARAALALGDVVRLAARQLQRLLHLGPAHASPPAPPPPPAPARFRLAVAAPGAAALQMLPPPPPRQPSPRRALRWTAYVEGLARGVQPAQGPAAAAARRVFLRRNVRRAGPLAGPHGAVAGPGALLARDATECRLRAGDYRLLWVARRGQVVYRARALVRARATHRALCRRRAARCARWCAAWARRHVTRAQHCACLRWLLGGGARLAALPADATRPPYRAYNRYLLRASADGSPARD